MVIRSKQTALPNSRPAKRVACALILNCSTSAGAGDAFNEVCKNSTAFRALGIRISLRRSISFARGCGGRSRGLATLLPFESAGCQGIQAAASQYCFARGFHCAETAQQELLRGVALMLGRKLQVESGLSPQSAIILGTFAELHSLAPELHTPEDFRADGYWLKRAKVDGRECLIIAARNDRGVLYGVFALLSKIVQGETLAIDEVQQPHAPIRWVNQWDNLDGSIERGYGGPPNIFGNRNVRGD